MLTDSKYKKLLSQIRRDLSKARSHKSVQQQLLQSYWSIGDRLTVAKVMEQAVYGDAVMQSLAEDLEMDIRSLQRAVLFRAAYGEVPETGLSWAHYRELVSISAVKERRFYELLAIEEGLSRDKMMMAIQSDVYSAKTSPKRKASLPRPTEPRYPFEAELVRVVDGDTIDVRMDVGFQITKEQRLRLARVNTFSEESKKGPLATTFVVKRLSVADRIVIQTKRADLHGRYLAHVFYSTRNLGFLETFDSGHYLNQQLLDEKLAMKMR